MFSDSMKQFF